MGLLNRLDHPYQGGGMFLGTFEDILNWGKKPFGLVSPVRFGVLRY